MHSIKMQDKKRLETKIKERASYEYEVKRTRGKMIRE